MSTPTAVNPPVTVPAVTAPASKTIGQHLLDFIANPANNKKLSELDGAQFTPSPGLQAALALLPPSLHEEVLAPSRAKWAENVDNEENNLAIRNELANLMQLAINQMGISATRGTQGRKAYSAEQLAGIKYHEGASAEIIWASGETPPAEIVEKIEKALIGGQTPSGVFLENPTVSPTAITRISRLERIKSAIAAREKLDAKLAKEAEKLKDADTIIEDGKQKPRKTAAEITAGKGK